MSRELHSPSCLARLAFATWALTVLALLLYSVPIGRFPPRGEDLGFYLPAAVIAVGPSLLGAWAVTRRRYWYVVLTLIAVPVAGFLLAYGWGLLTYGTGAEDGTVWRGIGGGVLGLFAAVAARLFRLTHRRLSRGTCPLA
jgi:hypothetical protein